MKNDIKEGCPDGFNKNVILVFFGTFLASFFNLLYQLIIAHKLSAVDFAAFNSLLSVYMIISSPLGNLQLAVVKYSAEFNAVNNSDKVKVLLSWFVKKTILITLVSFLFFYYLSFYAAKFLKISSPGSVYILTIMLSLVWLGPILTGSLQGLELFKWFVFISLITGALKLVFTYFFINSGFNAAGALGAFLISSLVLVLLSFIPLRKFISFKIKIEGINFREIFLYLFPLIATNLCYINLVTSDMILVKRFFSPEDAGIYSLAQVAGKIFLFLPGAISIVMFPAVSKLNAKNIDTAATLKRSLLYGFLLCSVAIVIFNLCPSLILRILTGKAPVESIRIARIFSLSMSLFALLFIFINYFLSLKDLRFIGYLLFFTILQVSGIIIFHRSLFQVQLTICINALFVLAVSYWLAFKTRRFFG